MTAPFIFKTGLNGIDGKQFDVEVIADRVEGKIKLISVGRLFDDDTRSEILDKLTKDQLAMLMALAIDFSRL